VQSQKIAMTKRSLNLIKEYRNYLWQTDNDGKIITTPEPGNDHALDAVRYAIVSIVPLIRRVDYINSLPHMFQHEKPANPAR
jgi:phage terminase large subunit